MTTKGLGSGVPPAAPGSGFGSVTHDTTVRNGVEPRRYCRRVSPLRAEIPHAGSSRGRRGIAFPHSRTFALSHFLSS
jgi:hypothetical protein